MWNIQYIHFICGKIYSLISLLDVANPSDFYSCVTPTVWIGLIMGLTPILPRKKGTAYQLVTNKWLPLTSFAYIIAYTLTILLGQNDQKEISRSSDSDSTVNVTIVILFVLSIITTYTIFISSFKNTTKVIDILKGLSETDTSLQQLGQTILYKRQVWYQMIMIVPLQFLQILLLSLQLWNAPKEHLPPSTFWITLMVVFPPIVQNLMESQFVLLTLAVYQRFQMINQQLTNLDSYIKQNLNFVTLRRLHTLVVMRDHLCDVSVMLDETYGGQMFASSVTQFELIVTTVFFCASNYSKAPINSLLFLGYGLVKTFELFRKVIACQFTQNQAEYTKMVVHKLLLLDSINEIKNKLMDFSLQLMHRQLQFTANGLFEVDARFIYTVAATLTTYMVILYQFNQSSPTCYINIANSSFNVTY